MSIDIEIVDAYALPNRMHPIYLQEEDLKNRGLSSITMKELNEYKFKIYLYTLDGFDEVQAKDLHFEENIQLFYFTIGSNLLLYPLKRVYGVKYDQNLEKCKSYYFDKEEQRDLYVESIKSSCAVDLENVNSL